MNEKRAKMLNRRAGQSKFKADLVLETLALKPGETIADIGAGGGYFTYRFSKSVGNEGKVYAVDTNNELLEYISDQAKKQGLSNIITLYVGADSPTLPAHFFDCIFLRDVTHHLNDRISYFEQLKKALLPDGKVAIIDYNGRAFLSLVGLDHHYVPPEILVNEMAQAGYVKNASYDFIKTQSFTVFTLQE